MPVRTIFHLVRHAAHDRIGTVLVGRLNGVHLSLRGRAQAKDLTEHFAREEIAAVITSPRERAQDTAEPIADALGFTPSGPEEPEKLRFSRDHRLEDRITAMLAEGKAAEARTALEEELCERAISAPLHRQYRSLLRDARDTPALLAHGRQWLHQKIVEGDARGALSLVQECLELDPAFAPLDAADWPPVIAAAKRAGLQRLADAARSAQGARPPAQSGSSS